MAEFSFGFDIDGVLTADDDGETNLWLTEASRYFGKDLVTRSFSLEEALAVSRVEVDEFIRTRAHGILRQVPVREHAVGVLQKLMAEGFSIHLITARRSQLRDVTEEWLKKHQVPYETLTMNEGENHTPKSASCKRLGVRFFVDDSYENCLDCRSAGIYTLMYYASHNRGAFPPVPVVYNWLDIQRRAFDFIGSPSPNAQL